MIRSKIIDFTNNFDPDKVTSVFRLKNQEFRHKNESISLDNEFFSDITLKEEANLDNDKFIVVCAKSINPLTERSSKKRQFEIAKEIIKLYNCDAGIFIFYDDKKCFRFSLVYREYFGKRSEFNFYKRFTYFVDPQKTNKTFILALEKADFSSLKTIKEAFSVEPLSKEFYQKIQSWFYWALSSDKIFFPSCRNLTGKDLEKEKSINLIRLITRLIFIWFLKEKNLVPGELFSEVFLKSIIKDFGQKTNYYNAILQNLFFATLNQEIKKRGWAKNEGWKKNRQNYGVKNLYRYEDKFLIEEGEIIKIFSQIPFLNGGLFDCLDKDDQGGEIIDGFTRRENLQTKIPDEFFFLEEEREVDLNQYGLKKRKISGLINILKSFNFTTDESTSVDQEIALDPEMLGKVFENLLAEYNPETSSTARKATGSYYTPRLIVDYMVEESLFFYLKNKINLDEDDLKLLLSYTDSLPENLNENTKKEIINNLINIKIIDPACGSGAFPMGILLKIVHILEKLDKDNKILREIYFQKAIEEVEKIFKDPQKQKEERDKRLKEINEIFDESINYPDYARKLFLIENCIYGVDIQPIAIHISKLRFFISLIIDQEKNDQKENFGIRALPNLDTKFVAANSLIDINLPVKHQYLFSDERIHQLINELKEKYHLHFRIKTRFEKKQLQNDILEIRKKMSDILKQKTVSGLRTELENIEKRIKHLQIENENISKKNFDIENVTQDNFFYQDKQEKINFKNNVLNKNLSEIKQLEKRKKEIEEKLKGDELEKAAKMIADFDIFDQNKSNEWFNSEWMFGLEEGFDIVIANPPYIQLQKNRGALGKLYEPFNFKTFEKTGDIYTLFYEKGLELLKEKGILAYITSNKWMRAKYGEKLRNFLANFQPLLLIDLGPNVFESATVDTSIIFVLKDNNKNIEFKGVELKKEERENIDSAVKNSDKLIKISPQPWFVGSRIEYRIKEKIERVGKPLKEWDVKIYRGILTGLNEAFIINTETKEKILANCKTEEERKRTEQIIKPILRGRDIGRYYYEWKGLWLIFIPWHFPLHNDVSIQGKSITAEKEFQKQYPTIYNHLLSFKKLLSLRNKDETEIRYEWYALQRCAATYHDEFEKEKVVWQEIIRQPQFHLDTEKFYIEATGFIMTGKHIKHICGLLNSKPIEFFFKKFYAGGGLGDEGFRYKKAFLELLPLPLISSQNQCVIQRMEILVDKIILAKKTNLSADTSKWEREIDQLIYKLYNLSEDEIKVIEEN